MLKNMIRMIVILAILISLPVFAEDMRADHMASEQEKQVLLQKVEKEKAQAKEDAKNRHQQIVSNREKLKNAIENLEKENAGLEKEVVRLEENIKKLQEEEVKIRASLVEIEAVNKELCGFIRGSAKDLDSLIGQSLQSAVVKDRGAFLQPMINQTRFPSMDDVGQMIDVLFDEIETSGQVRLTKGSIVDRKGHETLSDLLILGNFTAVYSLEKELGFLLFSDQSKRLFALSKLPESRIVKKNRAYLEGKSDGVFLDISKGGALRQLTHKLSLMEQVPKGGPIVWPLLVILLVAGGIILERVIFLARKRLDADSFTQLICSHAEKGEWKVCKTLCEDAGDKSVPNILKSGVECHNMDRIDMENVLQETILREIPSLERFLSTLGMLASIAPLLGLLGTVTGMINTFHVITYYGTGDPRMMSGGISEALVTTMLGLTVAIPIMLAHTLLSRRVETEIGQMEEKAVSFVNTVFKTEMKEEVKLRKVE